MNDGLQTDGTTMKGTNSKTAGSASVSRSGVSAFFRAARLEEFAAPFESRKDKPFARTPAKTAQNPRDAAGEKPGVSYQIALKKTHDVPVSGTSSKEKTVSSRARCGMTMPLRRPGIPRSFGPSAARGPGSAPQHYVLQRARDDTFKSRRDPRRMSWTPCNLVSVPKRRAQIVPVRRVTFVARPMVGAKTRKIENAFVRGAA